MLIHTNYDDSDKYTEEKTLPDKIDSISVSHDGGRISICINNEEIYYTMSGTRDCNITIDRT